MLATLLFLIVHNLGALTLAQVEALSPRRAGELLLEGRAHVPIIRASRKAERYIGVPGQTEYELVETAQAVSGGCVRHSWTARFRTSPGGDEKTAIFVGADSRAEVALRVRGCTGARYAILNGGVDSARALSLLQALRRIGTGAAPVRFSCRSEIDPQLCAGPEAARAAIRTTPVWAVSQSGGVAKFWLGEPGGGVVTTVELAAARPGHVTITRKVPAPF